ncbi:MAG: hypothetical protein RO257_06355 [Candidatus Kapabacteria bacterium]|nr:hypothetical protein [Candidatus Kapabacteria bacterium]
MKKYLLAILLSSLMMIFGCGKDDDENSLTAPTTDGKGTLSFLLNGEVWRPQSSSDFPFSTSSHRMLQLVTEYDSSKNKTNDLFNIEIEAGNNHKNQGFRLNIDSILYEGKYRIKEVVFTYNDKIKKYGYYKLVDSISNSNFVNITKIHRDYIQYVEGEYTWGHYTMDSYVSGTFEMTLKNMNGDSVVITDGRFDLKNQEYTNY